MEELLSNETAFDIFFHSLERVKNLRTFQEELLSGNEQLARKIQWIKVAGERGLNVGFKT